MLNNLHKYGIQTTTNNQYQLLLQLNKKLIAEIHEMKAQIDHDSYVAANAVYRRIIKEVNIKLFRFLLREQYYNYRQNYIDLNFIYDYDDEFNVRNQAFFRQIIRTKQIRNIIKHAVLKKFLKQKEDPEVLFKILIESLEKLVLTGAKDVLRCEIINGLVERKKQFIEKAKGLLTGGYMFNNDKKFSDEYEGMLNNQNDDMLNDDMLYNQNDDGLYNLNEDMLYNQNDDMLNNNNEFDILQGGASDATILLSGLFVFCGLEFYDIPNIKNLCARCIVLVNPEEHERVISKMENIINDTTITQDKKSIYTVVIVDTTVDETKIKDFLTLPNNLLERKQDIFKSIKDYDINIFKKVIDRMICNSVGVNSPDLITDMADKNKSIQDILKYINNIDLDINTIKIGGYFIQNATEKTRLIQIITKFEQSLSQHTIVEIDAPPAYRIIFGTYIELSKDPSRRIFKIQSNAENFINNDNLFKQCTVLFTRVRDFKQKNNCEAVNIQICADAEQLTLKGKFNVLSRVYEAFNDIINGQCSGELGWCPDDLNQKIKYVKIHRIADDNYQFQDQNCVVEIKRDAGALIFTQNGGNNDYYKKYLKYKNKYLQSF